MTVDVRFFRNNSNRTDYRVRIVRLRRRWLRGVVKRMSRAGLSPAEIRRIARVSEARLAFLQETGW